MNGNNFDKSSSPCGALAIQRFKVGSVCFGKMKGYAAWPGVIEAVDGRKCKIKFFGDQTW